MVALLVGIIIIRLLMAPSAVGQLLLENAPLVGIGRISYGLYLYHIVVLYGLRVAGVPRDEPLGMAAMLGLSLTAALVSYFAIERPFLRLKDRIGRRDAAVARSAVELAPEPACRAA